MNKPFILMRFVIAVALVLSAGQPATAADFEDDPEDVDYFGGLNGFLRTQPERANILIFSAADPEISESFGSAKARLYHVLEDELTLYCSCRTIIDGNDELYDRDSCGFTPIKDNSRAKRLEAEHILPASLIIKYDPESSCSGNDNCRAGESTRECCQRLDEKFNRAHNDLVNLYPAIGSVNAARSNHVHDEIPEEEYAFGSCDFEVDRKARTSEPHETMRGDIARVHFYMANTYGLTFPDSLIARLNSWAISDPVDEAERARDERIREIQGSSNKDID